MNDLERYYLYPGYIYASVEHTLISTVLGSCVSICLWNQKKKFGGMIHYIYPKNHKNEGNGKFGNIACPHLIKLMLDLGSEKSDLIAHVIGGAKNPILKSNIGQKNIEMAEKILNKHGLKISIWDVGGETGRKLVFNTATGELLIHKGAKVREGDWYK